MATFCSTWNIDLKLRLYDFHFEAIILPQNGSKNGGSSSLFVEALNIFPNPQYLENRQADFHQISMACGSRVAYYLPEVGEDSNFGVEGHKVAKNEFWDRCKSL